jgi:very-short-patch-repair endonuclease
MSSSAIARRVESGEWQTLFPSVYLVHGLAPTLDSSFFAACLWGGEGTVLSHRSAAQAWGFDVPRLTIPEIWTPGVRKSSRAIAHQGTVPPVDRTTVRSIPVTSVHRTLIDLGDVVGESVVEDALDCAVRRRMTSGEWLLKRLDDLGTRGRKGAALLKRLLDEDETRPSWLERRFVRLLAQAKLDGYVRELPLGPYRLDFAWLDVKLGVEVHGAKWHARRQRWSKDLARHNHLTSEGWTMLHFDWNQIDTDPSTVVDEVRATRSRLERRFEI